MQLFALIIGAIAGFIFYSSTMTSYKKAGAGQTYRVEASTDIKLTGRSDVRAGNRSRVDRGFYSGSVSSSGRSEAYHMPQSIKHTIQQAQKADSHFQSKPPQSRPPRPNADHRPAGHRGQGGPRGSGRR